MTEPQLSGLFDARRLAETLGVKVSTAEAIMRRVPKVEIEGLRKLFVNGSDVERYLKERTRA